MKEKLQPTSRPEFISRRNFLKIMGGSLGLVAASSFINLYNKYYDPEFKIYLDEKINVPSIAEAAQLAIRMNNIYKSLPPYKGSVSDKDLAEWVDELVPQYQYNGLAAIKNVPETAVFHKYLDGGSDNHTLGQSNCRNYIWINYGLNNEYSPWYNQPKWMWVVAHELAHIDQGEAVCSDFYWQMDGKIETTAQVVTTEVLSSIVNHGGEGGKRAMYPLVDGLKTIALDTVRYWDFKKYGDQNKMWRFDILRKYMESDSFDESHYQAWKRDAEEDLYSLGRFLEIYEFGTLKTIFNARIKYGGVAKELALTAPESIDYEHPTTARDSLDLNDTFYFLAHAEELAKDIVRI